MTTTLTDSSPLGSIETRSIDYVPSHERSGRLTDQATIWFAGSAHLLSMATGAIGIWAGLNLGWTLVALALGALIGTIPVSVHATQGPHLGLPQLVQSRPQFGRYGALAIWLMALIVYWGYVVFGGNMLGATAEQLGAGSAPIWAIITGLVAVLLAIYGYHWLHAVQRWITIALIIVLIVYTGGLAMNGAIPASAWDLSAGTFQVAPFFIQVSAAAAYQLSWAFFVSDYSRYMPANTNKGKIITWTSLGLFFGVFSFMAIGAVGAALLPDEYVVTALAQTADSVFVGLGPIMLVIGGAGLLGLMAMCVYGGSLTIITAMDSIKSVLPTRRVRIWTILVVGLTSTYAGAFMPADFLNTSFWTILVVLSYLMAPWTAINLTDFFLVRRGHYSIREMFSRTGIYGNWNMRGIVSYLVTFAIMIPFMILPFYTGPIATALGGVDIAFFIGIPLGGVIYWVMCLSMDMKAERAIVDKADANLDSIAKPIS